MAIRRKTAEGVRSADNGEEQFEESIRHKLLRYMLLVIPAPLTATTTAFAAVNHGPVRVYWSLGTIATLIGSGFTNVYKDRNASANRADALRTKTELATALNDTGQPLVSALGDVTSADQLEDAKAALRVLRDAIVRLARTELGRQTSRKCNVRSAYYALEGNKLERKSYHVWSGATTPRINFVQGRSEHDNEVIRFTQGEDALLVEDLINNPPPHFVDRGGRSYKCFISVPVRAGGKSFGLLTADSSEANSLTTVDRGFLILIAGTLAAGLAHVETIENRKNGHGKTNTTT